MPHGLETPVEPDDDRERADDMTSATRRDTGLLWGVGAVAIRLSIATPTLRTWERRYGIGPSSRTDGGHRRYSEDDIERVQLMQRLVGDGVPAQSAASVATSLERADLEAALSAPEPGPAVSRSRPTSAPPVAVASIIRATKELDEYGIDATCVQILEDLGVAEAWTDVFVPVLRALGEQWSDGSLGVEAEHLATCRFAAALRDATRAGTPTRGDRRPVLLCGADEDQHALPLLALEAGLAAEGAPSRCLGPRVPSGALGAAVARLDPAAVFLWASLDRSADDAMLTLLDSVDVPVVLGGPGWSGGAHLRVERCDDLRSALDRLCALSGG